MKYCKNSACKGADGYRRHKRCGFGGYCWTCGLQFEPTLAAAAIAKENARDSRRKAKISSAVQSSVARKKVAADISAAEAEASAMTKEQKSKRGRPKPSDYCKNIACKGADGYRRHRRCGLGGYCWTCGTQFEPALVAGARAKKKLSSARSSRDVTPDHWQCSLEKQIFLGDGCRNGCFKKKTQHPKKLIG